MPRIFSLALLLCISTPVSSPAASQMLLPTAPLAREVQQLTAHRPEDPDLPSRRRKATAVRDEINAFIIRQLEVMPSISAQQLQRQLDKIFCADAPNQCDPCNSPPYVFAADWGSKTLRRQIVVASQITAGFMGPGGTITSIDIYVWESGKARRSATGGAEFDGYVADFQKVAWHPDSDEYWILVWGSLQGSSGRGISGRAAVYRAGIDSVKTVWLEQQLLNVSAQSNRLGWEVSYADAHAQYEARPGPSLTVFDVYAFDYERRSFSRVVHYQK